MRKVKLIGDHQVEAIIDKLIRIAEALEYQNKSLDRLDKIQEERIVMEREYYNQFINDTGRN